MKLIYYRFVMLFFFKALNPVMVSAKELKLTSVLLVCYNSLILSRGERGSTSISALLVAVPVDMIYLKGSGIAPATYYTNTPKSF